jgi:hypothetical protein
MELAQDLAESGKIDITEAFIDGTFVPAKRGLAVGKTKRGKGNKIMAIADAAGFPVAAHVESASPHEVKLVEATIDSGFTQYAPDRLDTGYGRSKKAKTISADNPARYFPASDEQIWGPFSAEKYRTWFASLDSPV